MYVAIHTPSSSAMLSQGGLACAVHPASSSETVHFFAERSRANIMVVEDAAQVAKVVAIRERLPELKAIIVYRAGLSCCCVLVCRAVARPSELPRTLCVCLYAPLILDLIYIYI